MANFIYEIEVDGEVFEVEGPKGATEAQLRAAIGKPIPSVADATGGIVQDQPLTPAQPSNGFASFGRAFAKGVEDFALGASQLAVNLNPLTYAAEAVSGRNIRDEMAAIVAKREAAYGRTIPGQEGSTGRLIGGLVASAPAGIAALPARGAGFLRATAQAAAGGAALGAASQPTSSENYFAAQAKPAIAGAALGGGFTAGGRAGLRLAEEAAGLPIRMTNTANRLAMGRNPGFAAEGEELARRTGIDFTPGEISGSRVQTAAENLSRQSIFSADTALEADLKRAEQARNFVERFASRMGQPSSAERVGLEVQSAVKTAVKGVIDAREQVAKRQYGAINAALGGAPVVQYSNVRRVLEEIANGGGGTLSGDALRASRQARTLLDQVDKMPQKDIASAIQDRSFWGKSAAGQGNIFSDVSPQANRQFAARLFGAIKADLDEATTRLSGSQFPPAGVGAGGNQLVPAGADIGAALREADANYRRFSQTLTQLEASPLGRIIGKDVDIDDFLTMNTVPPEKVIETFGRITPSEMRYVRDFMESNAPDTWASYKRLLLDDAVENSLVMSPPSAGARVAFNASGFMRQIGGNDPKRIALLRETLSNREMQQLEDAFAAIRRMGDKFGYNFSGTASATEATQLYNGFFDRLKGLAGMGAANALAGVGGTQAVARAMLNADGRRAMIQLSRLPPGSRQAPALASYVLAVAAGQSAQNPVVSEGDQGASNASPNARPASP